MTLWNYVIVNHTVGKDVADRFELCFEMSGGGSFVRRDGSSRGRCTRRR